MRTAYSPTENVPLRGGMVTVREPPLLPYGAFSAMQNIRGKHPGLIKRKGQAKLHTTADGTNKVVSLYQFKKTKFDEKYFFAQMSDGDVLQATADPPTVTTGAFGTVTAHDGTATGMIPGSWGNIGDHLLYSNGSDQHQIYGGDENYVTRFIKYDGAAAPPNVPELGFDYTTQVTDGSTSTVAVLDGLNTYANNECVFICTPVPANRLKWTVSKPNNTDSVATLYYRKNDNTWESTSMTDGTVVTDSGETLSQTGSMTWTLPTDEVPFYMYGMSGFWYQLRVSVALDAEVEISSVTYRSPFQGIRNVWNGVLVNAIEVYVEGTTQYYRYGAGAVDLDELAASKKIVIGCSDPITGLYIDVGEFPNATGTAVTDIKYWDGDSFATVGTVTDGTNGLANSGFMTFPLVTTAQPLQFESSRYYAYWYELTLDAQLAADTLIGVSYLPYFDINDFGRVGNANCIWKDRGIVSFDSWPEYVYISQTYTPMVFNGVDYGILEAGDGRSHKIVAMRKFYNELLVWQEERGVEGGCLTMFEGYSPTTFGKILLSSKVGTFNNKSVTVVDGVLTSTATEEKLKTLAFFLSRYGVFVTDGASVACISDDIQNYFDPNDTNSIRRGYENEHWLTHDSAHNVIRIGLVIGSSATVPNTFLVFDLTDKTWSTDSLGQALSCAEEVEAGSGDIPVIQVGGGTADGTVYRLNTGTNDVDTDHPITSNVTLEFSGQGEFLNLRELNVRCKAQAAGNIALTVYGNEIAKISDKSLSMIAEVTNQTTRRHRVPMNITDQQIAVKLEHATASQEMYLYDLGVGMAKWVGR